MNAVPLTYSDWCRDHIAGHGHCPQACEKPQPVILDNGRCVCGRCLIDGVVSVMIPCTPDTCD